MGHWKAGANAVASVLNRASGVGKVYVGEEDLRTLAQIIELAEEPQTDEVRVSEQARINIWQIGRVSVSVVRGQLPPQQSYRIHGLIIRGYYGEGEGTWDRFQDIVDSVFDSLEGVYEIPNPDNQSDLFEIGSPEARTIGHSAFGPYSCHSVELRIDIRELRKSSGRRAV